ncbi:unnamed protein product [Gordionus sp. m RMFG-2023]
MKINKSFNLENLIEYESNFRIAILNGTDLNCTLYRNLKYRNKVVRNLFVCIASIIIIFGIIGNSLGLYCAMKDKIIYIRVYLTRVFYSINLVNYIFMLIYPVLDIIAEFHLMPFRRGLNWNLYMVHYHLIMSQTLINFSFGIYVIFGISQMMAIVYPLYYRSHFNLYKIKIMLDICFLYNLVWYIPSIWWFDLLKLTNLCGFPPELIVYTRRFSLYKNRKERVGWILLGFLMEIFTKFLPVAIILVLNYLSLKHKKSTIKKKFNYAASNLQETSSNINKAVLLPEFEKNRDLILDEMGEKNSGFILGELDTNKNKASADNGIKVTTPKIKNNVMAITMPSDTTSDSKILHSRFIPYNMETSILKTDTKKELQILRKIKKSELEYKLSIRMLAILMFQFVVLLLPVSVYIMTTDFFDELLTPSESEMLLAGCVLLQYVYISLTFYLNMMFNPAYREGACRILRKSKLGNLYNKRNVIHVDTKIRGE